jgi:hypothetical protein
LLTLVLLIGSCKPVQKDLEQVRFLIDSIQSRFIPDKRLEIFDIRPFHAGAGMVLKGESTDTLALTILIDKIRNEGIECIDSIRILPDKSLGENTWGLISVSVANFRYKAANEAEMSTQALMGTPVRILKEENNWLLVQTPDQYISWTQPSSLKRISKAGLDSWNNQERMIITEDCGLVYTEPDHKSLPVSDLVIGCILAADRSLPVKSGFTGVLLPDGRKGYIESFIAVFFNRWVSEVQPTSDGVNQLAARFLGRPYLWGGTSAKAFDCSGFTKTVYFMQGLILNRDASQQIRQGTEIPLENCWENLQTGDLLFFGRKANQDQTERVSHVGIYLGNSEFIHSSTGFGRVNILSLDSTRVDFNSYFINNLLYIRRFGNPETDPVKLSNHKWYN